MEEYLYRYISFESFVGMIQKKALTFVLPELWDDPKESTPFLELIKQSNNSYDKILLYSVYQKTYGQCWTRLSESDAMWRIYSYNNRAIRIKVAIDKLKQLPDVDIVPVKYSDIIEIHTDNKKEAVLQSLSIKRLAFQHENEVRLIKHYRFMNDEDMEQHIKGFLAVYDSEKGYEIIESMYPNLSLEEKVKKIVETLNIGKVRQETTDVLFESITNFIEETTSLLRGKLLYIWTNEIPLFYMRVLEV